MDYTAISPEELLLVCLRAGDQSAWAEFVRRFQPLIARVVLRVARQWGEASPQAIDDLIQETYLKLCTDRLRVLQNFESFHKDAIYGYVKVFTANLAHDYFKVAHSQKRGGRTTTDSMDGAHPDRMPKTPACTAALLERGVLIQQVDACLRAVTLGTGSDRERRLFWLYYRVGLTASAIAALPSIGLSTKGVETALLRLTRRVRQRLVAPKREDRRREESGEGIRPTESF